MKENCIKDLIISKLPVFLQPEITTEAYIKTKKNSYYSYENGNNIPNKCKNNLLTLFSGPRFEESAISDSH